jgi:hypothetical protein
MAWIDLTRDKDQSQFLQAWQYKFGLHENQEVSRLV